MTANIEPEQSLKDSVLFPITVPGKINDKHYLIKRSYPKGKPEKLITGLQQLLSDIDLGSRSTESSRNKHQWKLAATHDAIHKSFITRSEPHAAELTQAIARIAEELSHHPHIASKHCPEERWAIVVTCTTHVPHGLSLKDVKLARGINDAVDQINANEAGKITLSVQGPISFEELETENMDAARRARENSEFVCHVGKKGD